MKPNKPYANTYSNRVLQFAMDEEARREREKKAALPSPNVAKAKQLAAPQNGDNPYIRAYAVVFGKLPVWKQTEIKELEAKGDTENRYYADFVHEVRILGDQFSEQA